MSHQTHLFFTLSSSCHIKCMLFFCCQFERVTSSGVEMREQRQKKGKTLFKKNHKTLFFNKLKMKDSISKKAFLYFSSRLITGLVSARPDSRIVTSFSLNILHREYVFFCCQFERVTSSGVEMREQRQKKRKILIKKYHKTLFFNKLKMKDSITKIAFLYFSFRQSIGLVSWL